MSNVNNRTIMYEKILGFGNAQEKLENIFIPHPLIHQVHLNSCLP